MYDINCQLGGRINSDHKPSLACDYETGSENCLNDSVVIYWSNWLPRAHPLHMQATLPMQHELTSIFVLIKFENLRNSQSIHNQNHYSSKSKVRYWNEAW